MPGQTTRRLFALICLVLAAAALPAVVVRDSPEYGDRELVVDELDFRTVITQAAQLPAGLSEAVRGDLARLGVQPQHAYRDDRTGRWATLLTARPMIPGSGVGNSLTWADLRRPAPVGEAEMKSAALGAFTSWIAENESALGISPSELGRANVSLRGELVQIYIPRVLGGVPVINSYLTAGISHGNLILFGAKNWGDANLRTEPGVGAEGAMAAVREHLSGIEIERFRGKPELVIVPVGGRDAFDHSLAYRLAWTVRPMIVDNQGGWEAWVDARNGAVLMFRDMNHYADMRKVIGGVYPFSNDGIGPEGTEQPGWPMPFADVETDLGDVFTDSGGNLPSPVDGIITTTLNGLYIRISDSCGGINESSPVHIDLGTSGGTDCTTPPGGSNGNTHSSRSGFYELNRVAEWARTREPGNNWLNNKLTANMNRSFFLGCNAFWNGTSVNFYVSDPGCANTGELAGVFDHEWGHGLDDNDNNPNISFPGEGIADIYASLRLNNSCIGRGFFEGSNCSGYGDPCTDCDGVRDVDFLKRQSQTPHDVDWAVANCGGCGFFGTTHCLGAVEGESVWDLAKRDLPNLYGTDDNQSLEIATRLNNIGASQVGDWFTCTGDNEDGCAGESGYQNFLAADDDNGSLLDGTPHMQAIFDAFDRHGAACSSPAVQDSGCVGAPTEAPVVSASPLDRGAMLSWNAVAGASKYQIYRTEGVNGCDFGKALVGETAGTSFTDDEMLNNREYYYSVAPIGPADTCIGPMSACASVTPAATPPDLAVSGLCPGDVTLDVSGSAPNGPVGIVRGDPGSSELSMGQCTGMPLGISNPAIITTLTADGNGNASFTGNAGANLCGSNVVAVDLINCAASATQQLP